MKNKLKNGSIALVILIAIAYAASFVIGSSKGISWLSAIGAPTVESKTYNLEMEGYDGRLYTFTSPSGLDCISVVTSEGVGVTCSNKSK